MSAIPENRTPFSLAEVLAVTSGICGVALAENTSFEGVSTDTRANLAGKLFVALSGERYDAHDFLDQARRGGARAALVERPILDAPLPTIAVGSTLVALGDLARLHRRRFGGKLIAVGGSAGKTTTRSAIGALLELAAPGAVHQASGNLNNLIGVPHVLFGLGETQRFAVVELGTNAPGEVARLMDLSEPDVSVLTLVAIEHTEGLGDLDGVEREEGELFVKLGGAGAAVGNVDDARVKRCLDAARVSTRLGYGQSSAAGVRVTARTKRGLLGESLRVERPSGSIELDVPLLGDAGVYATLAALSVLELVAPEAARDPRALTRALSRAGEPGRLKPVELANGALVLDDTYNANPASVLSSIDTARELASARKSRLILVLGEMRELGRASEGEHRRVGEALSGSGAALLLAVGGDAELYLPGAQAAGIEARFVVDSSQAVEPLLAEVQPGDVVLVKASRGVRAERVVEGLIRGFGSAA